MSIRERGDDLHMLSSLPLARQDDGAAFLAQSGGEGAYFEFLAGDCSFRTYYRLHKAGWIAPTVVLMDAPPSQESIAPFIERAHLLRELGIRVPQIYAHDIERGFILLEDFGDMTYRRALLQGYDAKALYTCALELIQRVQTAPAFGMEDRLGFFSETAFLEEVALLTQHYIPAFAPQYLGPQEQEAYLELWSKALTPVFEAYDAGQRVLVLKDFHVDNLMVCQDSSGIEACGVLDFQDALVGPQAYDLVSLLQDARFDVPPLLERDMLDFYLSSCSPDLDRDLFRAVYMILGAQRATKILGVFARAVAGKNKRHLLAHFPRVWRHLEHALETSPFLKDIKQWFDETLPPHDRQVTR